MDADLEKLRNSAIPGYSHPDTTTTVKSSYKTYGTKKGYGTASNIIYNEYNATYTESCPTCKEKVFEICSCDLKEKYCKNNHVWWYDKKLQLRNENPHDLKQLDYEDEIRFVNERKNMKK
jgi:hypothetical protein